MHKSNFCPQNKKCPLTCLKGKVFPVQGYSPPGTTRRCRPNQSTRRSPPPHQSAQWTKIPTITEKNGMGSHNWTITECSEIAGRKAAQTSLRWNQRNWEVHSRTFTTRTDQSRQRTVCSQLLLCKESRWKTTTSTRLLTPKQVHQEELKCVPTNSPSNQPTGRMNPVHKVRHKMGIQQH